MKAEQAKEMANAVNEHPYKDVIKLIEQAAKGGNFNCFYYKQIPDATRRILESDGYYIGPTQQDRDGLLTEIRW